MPSGGNMIHNQSAMEHKQFIQSEEDGCAQWQQRWGDTYPVRPTTSKSLASRPGMGMSSASNSSTLTSMEKNSELLMLRSKLLMSIEQVDKELEAKSRPGSFSSQRSMRSMR